MRTRYFLGFSLLIVLLFAVNLVVGAVDIPATDVFGILFGTKTDAPPSWQYIVMQNRLPQAITAMLCGASLAVSGLMLQTAFRNPLAGPSIFGINSGASLGVALVMLLMGGSISAAGFSLSGFMAVLFAAFVGAMLVMALILAFSTLVKNNIMLLIKPLNALLLGEQYAENLGINTRRTRNWLLFVTGVLTAITTAFCGPVAFIGLAVPHIARMFLGTENHQLLMPATILTGAAIALVCNIICVLPGDKGIIPLNAVTPIMGAPVIIYVILKQRAH